MEDQLIQFNWLEALGTAFGIVQVLLARQNNIHNYLFGIVSILLSFVVLYEAGLYADILLNLYYLVMSIYGWVYWKFGRNSHETPITYSNRKDFTKAMGIVLGCFGLMVYWLSYHTNSTVPFWDACVSAFAWAGMWLMAKRKMENWIFLNISNILAIPLLIYKDLYVYALLTMFLFVMGVLGYLKWRNLYQNKNSNEPATT